MRRQFHPSLPPLTRTSLIPLLAGAFLVGCGSAPPDTDNPQKMPGKNDSTTTMPAADSHPVVRIDTSAGAITLRLDADRAPATVANFLDHVEDGFYRQTLVHFVDPSKMVLMGGFATDGQLKPSRYSIPNEAQNGLTNTRGTVAMARDATLPDSATTQFFINLADSPELDHVDNSDEKFGYCVFGKVVDGLDVADQISQVPTHDLGGDLKQTPQTPVVIRSMTRVE